MRVLIVEDDPAAAQSMELMLKAEGFIVQTTDLGEEGVDLAKLYDFDSLTLDLNLPDISGFEVLRRLRAAKITTPVIVVTGANDMRAMVDAYGAGCDDFMRKPFHRDELVCRLRALVRRSKGHAQSVIKTGEILLNLDAKTVEVKGVRVHLTGKEYQLLELLSLRKGATLTKEMFLNHLYGGMDEPELKIIDVFICKLRHKLRNAGADGHIHTVWGRGYILRDQPDTVVGSAPTAQDSRPFAILTLIAERPRTFAELVEATRTEFGAVRRIVTDLIGDHLAANVGLPNAAVYAVTGRGRERLKALAGECAA